MKRMLLGGVCLFGLAVSGPALAADLPAPVYKAAPVAAPVVYGWFVEGRIGAAFSHYDDLAFLNPIGVGATLSPVSGNFIILGNKSLDTTTLTGGASAGYYFTKNFFAKVSYENFGTARASGFALFPAGNFRQDLRTQSQGVLAGLGGDYYLTDALYIEGTVQAGIGFLRSAGQQGANLGPADNFPSANHTNFIAGGGLGVGYRVTTNFDLLVQGNYYWLGSADTGVTGNPAPGNMNPGEQLQAKLGVFTATAGARLRF